MVDSGFRVGDVLSLPLTTKETCCPGELHFTLALFALYKLSLSLTFGQICSRTQILLVVKFPSRGATLSKERQHPSVGAHSSVLDLCSQMCTLRKIVSQKISEAAFTMPQAFARPKRNTTELPWTKCSSGLVDGYSFPLNQQIKIRLSNSKLGYAAGGCSASPTFTGTGLPFRHPWHCGSLQQCSSVLVWECSHQAEHPPLPHLDWGCYHTDNHTFLLSSVMGHKNRQKKGPSSSISWLQHLAGIYGYENER